MIVISGVLVFVAAALLIDGVFFTGDSAGTPWQIWVSIAVSAGAALLLVAGALRERRAGGAPEAGAEPAPTRPTVSPDTLHIPPPAAAPAASAAPAPPAAAPAQQTEPVPVLPPPVPPAASAAARPAPAAGGVLVVPGRPRYHLAGCRYVVDRPAQPLDAAEARAAGYTACGVCRPDDVGAAPSGTPAPAPAAVDAAEEEADRTAARNAATPVVLVRNRYHRPDCRYVAVAAEREELTKAQARERGALPCGVCVP